MEFESLLTKLRNWIENVENLIENGWIIFPKFIPLPKRVVFHTFFSHVYFLFHFLFISFLHWVVLAWYDEARIYMKFTNPYMSSQWPVAWYEVKYRPQTNKKTFQSISVSGTQNNIQNRRIKDSILLKYMWKFIDVLVSRPLPFIQFVNLLIRNKARAHTHSINNKLVWWLAGCEIQ